MPFCHPQIFDRRHNYFHRSLAVELVKNRCYSRYDHSNHKQHDDSCGDSLFYFFITHIKHGKNLHKCFKNHFYSERILYMSLKILASLIILIAVVAHATKRQQRIAENREKEFWARERKANSVRKKPLDDLDYVKIPLDKLPMDALPDNERAEEYRSLLTSLSTQPIVNLTGFTNTDLKLEYGTANITPLSQYDQNYTVLVRTLQQWADLLLDSGLTDDAETVLAYAVSIGTDVSHTYYALAKIYAGRKEYDKIADLIHRAEGLRSALRNSIVRTLQESYPQACSPHCG